MAEKKQAIEDARIDAYIDALKDAPPGSVDVDKLPTFDGQEFNRPLQAFESTPDAYIPVWSHIDGGKSIVLVSMLSTQLKKKIPQADDILPEKWGKPAFSLQPTFEPVRDSLLCMLHVDHPMREELDGMGLKGAICRKANIPTDKDVMKHFERRHKDSWEVYHAAVDKAEREEDRVFQREMLESIVALMKDKE